MHLNKLGYQTPAQILDRIAILSSKFPVYASSIIKSNELTANSNRIIAYVFGLGHEALVSSLKSGSTTNQSPAVLVTSLHHGNELITTTVGAALVEEFASCIGDECLNNVINLIWVPHLNIDSLMLGDKTGVFNRKNIANYKCHDGYTGVDLNRNYDFHFAEEKMPCYDIEYEGPYSFSEPETRFIKYLATSCNIRSALNLHSFGNIWAVPYNAGADISKTENQSKAYAHLKKSMVGISEFESAPKSKVLGYSTYGSCSDYLLSEFGIIAMSPEIGSEADGFAPPDSAFSRIIDSTLVNLNQVVERTAPLSLHMSFNEKEIVIDNQSWYAMDDEDWTATCDLVTDSAENFKFSIKPLSSISRLTVDMPDNTSVVVNCESQIPKSSYCFCGTTQSAVTPMARISCPSLTRIVESSPVSLLTNSFYCVFLGLVCYKAILIYWRSRGAPIVQGRNNQMVV